MDFEAYLISKKIDSAQFKKAEPIVWNSWKIEFDQMHPASFTAQKLYLINPIRRKYQLKHEPIKHEPIKEVAATVEKPAESAANVPPTSDQPPKTPSPAKPVIPRPVFKPKPKTS